MSERVSDAPDRGPEVGTWEKWKLRMAGKTVLGRQYSAFHQLYPECETPPPLPDPERVLDIFFIHGLQVGDGTDAWKPTWTNEKQDCWPRHWLPGEAQPLLRGPARVVSISYSAQATGHFTSWSTKCVYGRAVRGHKRISETLFHSLVSCTSCGLGTKPFVLVGHSYGGIVIKSLVVYCHALCSSERTERLAKESATKFMANIRGVVFYGVPQKGSHLATYASSLNSVLLGLLRLSLDVTDMSHSGSFSAGILELTENFEIAIENKGFLSEGVSLFAFGETCETRKVMVVTRESAQGDLPPEKFMDVEGEDHISICKPRTRMAQTFVFFVDFLKKQIIGKDPGIHRELVQSGEALSLSMRDLAQSSSDPQPRVPAITNQVPAPSHPVRSPPSELVTPSSGPASNHLVRGLILLVMLVLLVMQVLSSILPTVVLLYLLL